MQTQKLQNLLHKLQERTKSQRQLTIINNIKESRFQTDVTIRIARLPK